MYRSLCVYLSHGLLFERNNKLPFPVSRSDPKRPSSKIFQPFAWFPHPCTSNQPGRHNRVPWPVHNRVKVGVIGLSSAVINPATDTRRAKQHHAPAPMQCSTLHRHPTLHGRAAPSTGSQQHIGARRRHQSKATEWIHFCCSESFPYIAQLIHINAETRSTLPRMQPARNKTIHEDGFYNTFPLLPSCLSPSLSPSLSLSSSLSPSLSLHLSLSLSHLFRLWMHNKDLSLIRLH